MAVDSVRARTDARVRARGVPRQWRLCAGAFLVGSLLVGLGVGPVGIGIGGIAAVKSHRVIAVDDSVASRWGPRIVDFARAIATAARKQ